MKPEINKDTPLSEMRPGDSQSLEERELINRFRKIALRSLEQRSKTDRIIAIADIVLIFGGLIMLIGSFFLYN